jgi:uncharacterized coiled-coil protein SlyX
MAEESISIGWVLAGVGTVVAALAGAVRWLVREKDRQTDARIEALESAVIKSEAKLEKLNSYIRDTLNHRLIEAHQRERRLARVIAKFLGDSDEHEPAPVPPPEAPDAQAPAPTAASQVATEPITKPSRNRMNTPRPVPPAVSDEDSAS